MFRIVTKSRKWGPIIEKRNGKKLNEILWATRNWLERWIIQENGNYFYNFGKKKVIEE